MRDYERRCVEIQTEYRNRCKKMKNDFEAHRNQCLVHNHFAYRANSEIGEAQRLLKIKQVQLAGVLISLYEMDVVHKKYRNWIAVTSFCEYLEAGRCYDLMSDEGALNGAYNIYEDDLKTKTITDRLDVIIKQLQIIQNTQHKMYLELIRVNENLDGLKATINNGILAIKQQTEANAKRVAELSGGMAKMSEDMEKGFLQMDEYLEKLEKSSEKAMMYLETQKK
jgi:predicted transcriptional regulator